MKSVLLRGYYIANGGREKDFKRWFKRHKCKLSNYAEANYDRNANGVLICDYFVEFDELELLGLGDVKHIFDKMLVDYDVLG